MQRGKNVAIANALQLEVARATPALSRFLRGHTKFDVTEPIHFRIIAFGVFAADTLLYAVTLTFDPVTLTFDL